MTIELQNFSSEAFAAHLCVQSLRGFIKELFLQIFLNSVIYETFPLRIYLATYTVLSFNAQA